MKVEQGAVYEFKFLLVVVMGKCLTDTDKEGVLYRDLKDNTSRLRMTREELFIQEAKEVDSITWKVKK